MTYENYKPQKESKIMPNITINDVDRETMFVSGPGGQNVNKVESGVRLRFNIQESNKLNAKQKRLLLNRLLPRLTKEGELLVKATDSRSQQKNSQLALERLNEIIKKALKPKKKRILTNPTKSSKKKRMRDKKQQSEKKKLRKPPKY